MGLFSKKEPELSPEIVEKLYSDIEFQLERFNDNVIVGKVLDKGLFDLNIVSFDIIYEDLKYFVYQMDYMNQGIYTYLKIRLKDGIVVAKTTNILMLNSL